MHYVITYSTNVGVMMIMISLRIYCDIITCRFHYVGTCNCNPETFHERWRMPGTWQNIVRMQDDIRMTVSDSTKNLCELKTMATL